MAGWLTGTLPGYASVTGLERVNADTALAGGASPQTVELNLGQFGALSTPRNALDNGNLSYWQRGTSFTGITNTATYTADRWAAVGGASSSISVSRQAVTAGAIPGLIYGAQFGRAAANADTAEIKFAQVIETNNSVPLQGQPAVLSFYAIAGANFSAAGGNVKVSVYGGAGTNDTLANMLSGSWTSQATLYQGNVSVTNTTWGTRFVVNNGGAGISIPVGTTQLGVVFSYTPAGTAGANDWVQFSGVQLEQGYQPSLLAHLKAEIALANLQRYFLQLSEPADGVLLAIGGATAAANNQKYVIPLPVQMIKAPTVTVSAGSFKMAAGTTAATATGLAAASTHTVNAVTLVTTVTQTAGQAAHLQGGGGSGYIAISADF